MAKKKEEMKKKPCACKKRMEKETPKQKAKVKKVMHEFKEHELHSGSKKGPKVKNPKQAIAIALTEAKVSKKKKK